MDLKELFHNTYFLVAAGVLLFVLVLFVSYRYTKMFDNSSILKKIFGQKTMAGGDGTAAASGTTGKPLR